MSSSTTSTDWIAKRDRMSRRAHRKKEVQVSLNNLRKSQTRFLFINLVVINNMVKRDLCQAIVGHSLKGPYWGYDWAEGEL